MDSLTIKTEALRALELPVYRPNFLKTKICIYTVVRSPYLTLFENYTAGQRNSMKTNAWVERV